jgi:hypothetical protein
MNGLAAAHYDSQSTESDILSAQDLAELSRHASPTEKETTTWEGNHFSAQEAGDPS